MNSQEIEFKDKQGRKIVGTLLTPDGEGLFPAVILCHGFRGNSSQNNHKQTSERLVSQGLACLRFDFTADTGKSTLPFEDMTVSYELEVLDQAVSFIKSQPKVSPDKIGLIGHSLGGLLVAWYAAKNPEINSLALLSPVYDYKIMFDIAYDGEPLALVKERGYGWSYSSGLDKKFKLKFGFYEDIEKYDMDNVVENITCPTLVLHGTADEIVQLENSQHYYDRSQSRTKELKIIKGADHGYSDPEHLEEVAHSVAAWFSKTLK